MAIKTKPSTTSKPKAPEKAKAIKPKAKPPAHAAGAPALETTAPDASALGALAAELGVAGTDFERTDCCAPSCRDSFTWRRNDGESFCVAHMTEHDVNRQRYEITAMRQWVAREVRHGRR